MITIRRSEERGHVDHGWLDTYHTFSFASYQDPRHMGFGALRVINEDRVAGGQGFGTHPHRDMEILTWVVSGRLRHRDSMGHGSVIGPGEIQRMTAGTGVTHSEFNDAPDQPVHLLQIWILPERPGLAPGYEQLAIAPERMRGRLARIAGHQGGEGAVAIHQDAALLAGEFAAGETAEHPLAPGRRAWVQVVGGSVTLGEQTLHAGDGAALTGEPRVRLAAQAPAQVLVFDLA